MHSTRLDPHLRVASSIFLKGHLWSHFEEKLYKCHWPGCGKGFAKEHDCKWHEQLNSNFWPFECEGCRKQFARMDALNRREWSVLGFWRGEECWGNRIVGWRQIGADILFGVTLWSMLISPGYEREKRFFLFLFLNLFMITFLLYLNAYKGRPVMYK